MSGIRLPKLPDRAPVKLSISILPDLHQRLQDYATAYAEHYGSEEPVVLSGQSAPCLSLH
jgi:hypothetical protein